jgi:lipoate-protein ligase A
MAFDEALFEAVAAGQGATLRFYRWREPTLSLGYFQRRADREGHAASRGCPLVRRPSGGGAIVHDRELTYSLVVPECHALAAEPGRLYGAVHEAVIAALDRQGVSARLGCQAVGRPATDEPFLCFRRRAAGDVLLADAKIAGSAQRRRQGAVLQHGSLLLARSPAAPELPGVLQLTGIRVDGPQLIQQWLAALEPRLDLRFDTGSARDACIRRADELAAQKYATPAWTARR